MVLFPPPPTHLDAHEQGGDGEATGRGERQGESWSIRTAEPFCLSQATEGRGKERVRQLVSLFALARLHLHQRACRSS